jgi:hypothetical protein
LKTVGEEKAKEVFGQRAVFGKTDADGYLVIIFTGRYYLNGFGFRASLIH